MCVKLSSPIILSSKLLQQSGRAKRYTYDAKKKGQLTKQLFGVQKNIQGLRRVVECLFLSDAGPKRGFLSYLTEMRVIFHTSDVSFLIIDIRYDKHPLFGPASSKNKPSTTRRKPWFFSGLKSVDLFF